MLVELQMIEMQCTGVKKSGTILYSPLTIMAITRTTLHFCLFEISEGHVPGNISTSSKGYNSNFRQLTLQSKSVRSFETSKTLYPKM